MLVKLNLLVTLWFTGMLKQLHFSNVHIEINTLGGQACVFEVDNKSIFHPLKSHLVDASIGGLFPMVPIANRVEGNRFINEGRLIELPNVDWDKEFFLHGDGWKKEWQIYYEKQDEIALILESHINDDIHYLATLSFKLAKSQLIVTLKAKNLSSHPFPFNIGLHPFFYSSEKSYLIFSHQGYWPETEKHLPKPYQVQVPKQYNFQTIKTLTQGWINHCYKVSSPVAELIHHDMGYKVEIEYNSDYLTIYQPECSAPYVCIEPQCFPINAHNFMEIPTISPEDEQQITMTIQVKDV
ncbi:hypothetical protein C1O24_03160 [Vibrio diazotrophicus]|nr:hypothetical protein C1O24_03160 [Vibrio diazotrophicus]